MRDSQRSKVYQWESTLPSKELSLDECKALIIKACHYYGKAVPLVKDGRGTTTAKGYSEVINLPRWARNTITVLHEVAHSVHTRYRQGDEASHGREFMRIFIELLAHFKVGTRSELARSARAAGIKVAPVAAIPKRESVNQIIRKRAEGLVREMSQKYALTPGQVKSILRSL